MPRMTRCEFIGKDGKRCNSTFQMKKVRNGWKRFCSDKCSAAHSNANRGDDFGKRDNEDAFDTALRLAESYYAIISNEDRQLFLLRTLATATKDVRTRRAITLPALMKPDMEVRSLFFKRQTDYLTIAELMKRFCWNSYERSVFDMVKCDRIIKPINNIDPSSYDMRIAMRPQTYRILSEEAIEDKMNGRPAWLTQYLNQMHREAEDFFANENEEIEIKLETAI